MALNLSFLNSIVSSNPISGKVGWPAATGFIATTVTSLIHQYAPSVTLPTQATMIALAGILMTAVGDLVPHRTAPKSDTPAAPAPAADPVNAQPAPPPAV